MAHMDINPYKASESPPPEALSPPPQILVAFCGFMCILFAFMSFTSGAPRVWAPFPLMSVIPALIFFPLILVIPVFVFYGINRSLCHASSQGKTFPRGITLFSGAALILNGLWIVYGWNYGVTYQGAQHVIDVATINFGFAVLLLLLWRVGRKPNSSYLRLAFSTVFSIWLFWYAFPWMGELP